MSNVTAKSRQQLVIDLLFHALRVNDRTANEHAAEILSRTGPELTRRLVLEAARKKNSLPHRLRLLAVVERAGQLSGPDDWFDLNALAADKNPKIRAAAARCVVRCPPPPAGGG